MGRSSGDPIREVEVMEVVGDGSQGETEEGVEMVVEGVEEMVAVAEVVEVADNKTGCQELGRSRAI